MQEGKGNLWDRQLHVALEQAGKGILSTVKEISGFVDHVAGRITGGVQNVELLFNNVEVQESIVPAFAVSAAVQALSWICDSSMHVGGYATRAQECRNI